MNYISTRGYEKKFSSAEAIKQGIAPDGGLFVPEEIPQLSKREIMEMTEMTYPQIAATVISKYLTDFTYDELLSYTEQAYAEEKFGEKPAPLVQLNKYNPREYILELWHGPTAAFKDMALQLLPHLMTASAKKTGENRKICILTATSGDTGKAALEGFKDLPGTEVIVFYPSEGVSDAQKQQMITTEGNNVHVVAVNGCFDDAQSGVKAIFGDPAVAEQLNNQGCVLSSANSINWGRLVPQIAYYVASYVELLKYEEFNFGEKMNVVVPTGNFGNILAAWFAKKMGIPIRKLICASNKNKVLSDFFRSGTYDRNREFYKTNSPSMDILISSNLERLLFEVTDMNAKKTSEWMEDLKTKGTYTVDPDTLKALLAFYILTSHANCHAEDWWELTYARYLYPKAQMASQRISEALADIGSEEAKRSFFKEYIRFLETLTPGQSCEGIDDGILLPQQPDDAGSLEEHGIDQSELFR